MITFKPITIEDKAEIESFTLPYAPANCDLAFANMFCWQFQFKTAEYNCLDPDPVWYLYPVESFHKSSVPHCTV